MSLGDDKLGQTFQLERVPDGHNSLTAQFYLPATTEHPPALPVPGRDSIKSFDARSGSANSSRKGGNSATPDSNVTGLRRKRGEAASATQTFAALCGLWVISSQITWFYHQTASRRISIAFALSKYNLLMAWAANLSEGMTRGEHSPAHVLVCQYVTYRIACKTKLPLFTALTACFSMAPSYSSAGRLSPLKNNTASGRGRHPPRAYQRFSPLP